MRSQDIARLKRKHQKDLSDKNSDFYKVFQHIEKLQRENKRLCRRLRDSQRRQNSLKSTHSREIRAYKRKMILDAELHKRLLAEVADLREKARKYDSLKKEWLEIRLKAELDAERILECAQEQSRDAVEVIDEVFSSVATFKVDINRIKNDLKIGALTAQGWISSLEYALEENVSALEKIKSRFYKKNRL